MPLVTVALSPHPEEGSLLQAVADAVAEALGLGDGDVIAAAVPLRSSVASGHVGAEPWWAIATVHGSHRGEKPMQSAMEAARGAILDWASRNGIDVEGVWTEWILPLTA